MGEVAQRRDTTITTSKQVRINKSTRENQTYKKGLFSSPETVA